MKLYTKTGDKGETGILGKSRVMKDDARIEAYGSIDELNAVIGLCVNSSDNSKEDLKQIQSLLFELGSELAYEEYKELIHEKDIILIENMIDKSEAQLTDLTSFILPGGTDNAVIFHLARTICRRAERRLVTFSKLQKVNEMSAAFINRLSDLFFTLARLENRKAGIEDLKWHPRG